MKQDYLQVRISEDEKTELNELVAGRDISVSQFVREAIREKVAKIRKQRPVESDRVAEVAA